MPPDTDRWFWASVRACVCGRIQLGRIQFSSCSKCVFAIKSLTVARFLFIPLIFRLSAARFSEWVDCAASSRTHYTFTHGWCTVHREANGWTNIRRTFCRSRRIQMPKSSLFAVISSRNFVPFKTTANDANKWAYVVVIRARIVCARDIFVLWLWTTQPIITSQRVVYKWILNDTRSSCHVQTFVSAVHKHTHRQTHAHSGSFCTRRIRYKSFTIVVKRFGLCL